MKPDPPLVDTRLSKMIVDANKDWGAKRITNVTHVVGGMALGDVAAMNSSKVVKVSPGGPGSVLKTRGRANTPLYE